MVEAARTCDVAVVGSGPAGAEAARCLAVGGLQVLLIEKAHIPRYKTCGGGILPRAVAILGESSLPVAEHVCRRVEFMLSDQLRFSVVRDNPLVTMTMRDTFDAWLAQRAIAAGAELRQDCALHNVVLHEDHVELAMPQGSVRARYVVAADGANSLIAKKAGFADRRRLVPALECELEVSANQFERLSAAARFDFGPIPRGYAWVFPKKAHLSVGLLTLKDGENLNRLFDAYVKWLGLEPVKILQRHGYVIPLSPRDRTFARERILMTGDAAGLADPVTAEGITHAIWSGQLAAEAILGQFGNPQQVRKSYDALLEKHILSELRWARRVAKVLYDMPRLRTYLFSRHGQRLAELMAEIICGKRSYGELLTRPGNYLRLLRSNS